MDFYNVLNNKFMKSALKRKSEKTIDSKFSDIRKSSNSLNWDDEEGLDSPLRQVISVPE